jgi:hypothetical protein
MIPCQGAEPQAPLCHSLKTCKAPERDSQNRHGDHQGSDTESRNAHRPISEGFRLILPQRARFPKILGASLTGRALQGFALLGRWSDAFGALRSLTHDEVFNFKVPERTRA